MNLHPVAQAVKSQGRGPDTMLVHMAPSEVQGLQALAMAHGGSLTINPETGLPEAGFLSNILPMLIGLGLTAATGGAAAAPLIAGMSNAATIGLGVGGFEAIRTGSLEKGLMAGLGAYGGAGLGGALSTAGAGAAGGAGAGGIGGVANAAVDTGMGGAGALANGAGGSGLVGGAAGNIGAAGANAAVDTGMGGAGALANGAGGSGLAAAPAAPAATSWGNMVEGVKGLGTTTPLPEFAKANWKYMAGAAAPFMQEDPAKPRPVDDVQYQYTYDPGRVSEEDLDKQRQDYASKGITGGELKYFNPVWEGPNKVKVGAKGGLVSLAAGGMAKGGFVVPADVVSALGNGSTDAGLRMLEEKLGAVKHIKGAGDGLSDSIATHIDGKQPARVADGEAYIDPNTVAKLGGGDPESGSKKLYAMMDKIRQQAHGKKTQQRKVNPRALA